MGIYGFILRWLDIRGALKLYSGLILESSHYFTAGAIMVTAMESLFFIVNGIIACLLVSFVVKKLAIFTYIQNK
jgi:hypothetical protein